MGRMKRKLKNQNKIESERTIEIGKKVRNHISFSYLTLRLPD